MANYQKFTANYIKRQHHQFVNGGRIFERNWLTTRGGNVLRFGYGKTKYYENGNFVFTTSNVPDFHKKNKLSVTTNAYMYDDVKSSDGTVNQVELAYNSVDLRDYVYWGSCEELVRTSVENIMKTFPGKLTKTPQELPIPDVNPETGRPTMGDEGYEEGYVDYKKWVISNPFDINLHYRDVKVTEEDYSPLKFMCKSWGKYEIFDNGNNYPIIRFAVNPIDLSDIKCKDETQWWYDGGTYIAEITLEMGEYALKKNEDGVVIYDTNGNPTILVDDEGHYKVNEGVSQGEITIYAWNVNDEIVYTTEEGYDDFTIKPQNWVIDDYFNNLKGFEKQLLREDTDPVFTNDFVVPYKANGNEENEKWDYERRKFSLTSTEYGGNCKHRCLSLFKKDYLLLKDLQQVGMRYDEIWCDNLYRNMTHESIKNFDWSYSQEYYEGDEVFNVEGGNRFRDILRVIGRVFDDLKFYADNIKNSNNIGYSGINNLPNALISDMLEMYGWELYSTMIDGENDTTLQSEKEYITKDDGSKLPIWFPKMDANDIYTDVVDVDFMRRLMLSGAHIMRSKGTQESIEMILGMFGLGRHVDYELEEVAYAVIPKEASIDIVNGSGDEVGEGCTTTEFETTTVLDDEYLGSTLLSDVIRHINVVKGDNMSEMGGLLYENMEYSGIPLEQINLCTTKDETKTVPINSPIEDVTETVTYRPKYYLVPYFRNDIIYDGDVTFQSAGGWGKNVDTSVETPEYEKEDGINSLETLSYLRVVATVSDLLNMNPIELEEREIIYVADLSDYVSYVSEPIDVVSHYFCIHEISDVDNFSSWKNVFIKKGSTSDDFRKMTAEEWEEYEYEIVYDDEEKVTRSVNIADVYDYDYEDYCYDYRKAVYLESIISINVGNNPHVGYGNYDYGNKFYDYVEQPFFYSKNRDDLFTVAYENILDEYLTFEWVKDGSGDKKVYGTPKEGEVSEMGLKNKEAIFKREDEESIRDKCCTVYPIMYGEDGQPKNYHLPSECWFINTKILKIKNLHTIDTDGENGVTLYNQYFKNVIMQYLLQIIPATTILKLYDFN